MLTSAAADSGSAASLRARLAKFRAGIQASLARTAAAAKPNRWAGQQGKIKLLVF